MKTLKSALEAIVADVFAIAYPEAEQEPQLEYTELQFGHFASNIALQSAHSLGVKPQEIAAKLVELLSSRAEIAKAEAHPAGFVNITLEDAYMAGFLQSAYEDTAGYIGRPLAGQTMVIDYSHPNIGKPMGVHHLLSTVIGDGIKLLHRQLGAEVIADNFVGDLGTQFGKLIHAIKTWGKMDEIEQNPVPELLKLYVQFHINAEADETLDDAGRAEYAKLEQGDAENRALLQKILQWSKQEMLAVYETLGVEFDYMNGESFYEDKMSSIIELGRQKGIFYESEGALVCDTDNPDEPPAVVLKSDGTTLYLTRDLAQKAYWEQTWHPDKMVFVVDIAQSLQLKQVFEVADKLGLTDADMIHVAFGRMQFSDGSMSTRKGNIVLVEDVIEQTRERVAKQIVAKSKDLSELEQAELRDILAINALKYNILRQNRLSNITFDWDSMLALEGNSAPYLAYTLVRANSIAEKALAAGVAVDTADKADFSEHEIALLLQILQCSEVFGRAAAEFQPSIVANYCYELARLYNSFYNAHTVLEDSDRQSQRVLLNAAALRVMRQCFAALGLRVPTKM